MRIALVTFLIVIGFASNILAQKTVTEGHVFVALRMIGHQILLQSGDSTSHILPIEKVNDRYKLQFVTDFHFEPEQLVSLVNSVIKKSQIAESYLVEIESCYTEQVVYSYKIGESQKFDLVPCQGRIQPKGCYILFFTILDVDNSGTVIASSSLESSGPDIVKTNYTVWVTAIFIFLLFIGIAVRWMKERAKTGEKIRPIDLGEYQFDPLNLELRHNDIVVELSSKESDLLLLLHGSANKTLERDHILKNVWGDDGAYIGRTLDVFISRLRKKLDADPMLKIINIRGVGYKFILNNY